MNPIPYGHQSLDEEDINAVIEVLRSEWLTGGPKIPEFEEAICRTIGCRNAVLVNSGTSALDISVQALDLRPGSEVITTPFTFAATSNCLLYHGLRPVYADIESDTRNIDPDRIREKITRRTKGIVAMDYAGHPCTIAEIRDIAREHDLVLIEDACHAFGASFDGRKIGTFADLTVFSFHPVKPITTGEGGAVVTDNSELASRLRLLRSHGIDRDEGRGIGIKAPWAYDMRFLGRNYRMTDLQAALGNSQLKKLHRFLARRKEIADHYNDLLADVAILETPVTRENVTHGWHLYTVLVNGLDRNRFFLDLRAQQIGVNLHYIPTYRFTYYRKHLPVDPNKFPVTEDIFQRIITLPLYPGMTDESIERVVHAIRQASR
jgi:UDP-4-amino-4,6-dideoxy-N-acetyl-beta-L-altrosamine transaminase